MHGYHIQALYQSLIAYYSLDIHVSMLHFTILFTWQCAVKWKVDVTTYCPKAANGKHMLNMCSHMFSHVFAPKKIVLVITPRNLRCVLQENLGKIW